MRRYWKRIAACLAVLVMLGTGYAMILPAATMENGQAAESVELSGDWGEDLAAVAQSQIGYTESSTDTVVNDAGETCGSTRYGEWYGDEYGDWNGMFLAFCLHYAEIPEDAVKADADTAEMLRSAQEKGFYEEAGVYQPEVGDIAFLLDDQAGIVTEISEEGVSVTAGDIDGAVAVIEQAQPLGYGSMEEARALYDGTDTDSQPADEGEESTSGQNSGPADETTAGDRIQTSPGESDAGTQADQDSGSDGGDVQIPDNEAEEKNELTGTENDVVVQADEYPSLEEYVYTRGFGNEDAAFEENLMDANGQTIEPDDEGIYHIYEGEAYKWSINLYAPAGLPEAGTYEYPLPYGIKAEGISIQEITADDGKRIGTLEVSEDRTKVLVHIVDNTKIRVRVYFEIYLDIEVDEEGFPVNQEFYFIPNEEPEEPTVEKSHEITSEGKIEWCIRIHAPGWKEGEYPTLLMYDYERDGIKGYYPDYSKAEITITQNGRTWEIPSVREAGDEDDLAWYADNAYNLWFVSRKTSHTGCSGKGWSGLPEEWCTDWCQTEDSVITVKYIEEEYDITNTGTNIRNTAIVGENQADDEIEIPGMIDKGDINKQTGEFTITVNPGLIDLSAQEDITVQDSMGSHLFYQGGSMSITATDEDGIEQVLTYGSDYSLEVSQELHHLEINIPHPGKYIYTITYKVYVMTGGNKDDDYKNTATLNVFGWEFKDESSGYDFSSGAQEYVISIRKTEQESQEVVDGAEYGLYGSNGELMATGTTDGSGEFTFFGDPEHGFILASGQLYYIQETEAPEGYYLSDTRYWFYYDDSEENVDYDNYIKDQLSAATLEGLYRETDKLIENVPNHGYTNEPIEGSSETAEPIEVTDQRIWYELPETGSTGTIMYTIAGLLLTGSAVTALYREKCKKRGNKK